MKSRTSFCNKTIFRKNLSRFAPAWGLYTVFLLMALLLLMDSGSRWFASNLADFVQIMSVFTPCYALLCVQLLFGDLYNTRMCNALHALPLRRETWFLTNVLSGFAFHLIPTVIFTVLAALVAVVACYPGDWIAAVLWLLGVNLQFICFFGIAVLSAFCVGNRFAQAVVYGIVNFGALVVGWLADTVFVPMYYGIRLNLDPVFWFSPMARMIQEPFCEQTRAYSSVTDQVDPGKMLLGENFFYYFLVAAVGIGLMFLALRLYRRRKLECAGDFLAFPGMEPVFLAVYTIIVGTAFQFVGDDLFGMDNAYFFLFLGLAVGWFTGKMLLERTPRVFRRRNFLGGGILMAACALTLVVAAMDPFGIESWIPDVDKVESVTIADGHYNYHHGELTLEDPADIRRIIDMHREAVEFYEKHGTRQFRIETASTEIIYAKEDAEQMNFNMALTFRYHMKSGRTISRYYSIWMGDDTGDVLRQFFSSPEAVFGSGMNEERFLTENSLLVLRDTWEGKEIYIHEPEDIRGLYRAIIADCEAGTMAQAWEFHHPDENLFWIDRSDGEAINIFSNAENILRWIRDYGVDVDAVLELHGK